MKLTRRTFVKWFSLSGIAAFIKPLPIFAKTIAESVDIDLPALKAYIDLILPKDELPGAIELGADKVLLQKAEHDARYAQTLGKGADWLNFLAFELGGKDFATLAEAQQSKIVSASESSPIASLPNLFYHTVRQDVFQFYYGHPEIVKHFHYAQPPQPHGFSDFAGPPII